MLTPDPLPDLRQAFADAGQRPAPESSAPDKKNYAEKLSRRLATAFANALRHDFPPIQPDEKGRKQESRARTSKGVKKLDVNYSTPELGLGLGVSIKTLNFRDSASGRYTKNFTRIDNELRAEAKDYHERQPYAVLIAVVFLPVDSCDDGDRERREPSSFGQAIRIFRHRSGRRAPRNEQELFEDVFVGLYEIDDDRLVDVRFFDVLDRPPMAGRLDESCSVGFAELVDRIRARYDERNNPPFEWR